jgi:hypothetical protein
MKELLPFVVRFIREHNYYSATNVGFFSLRNGDNLEKYELQRISRIANSFGIPCCLVYWK